VSRQRRRAARTERRRQPRVLRRLPRRGETLETVCTIDLVTKESPTGDTHKKLLAMVKPSKPVNEMTDDERDAFADELYRLTVVRAKDGKESSGDS
jgi:hypothetical protein